jgi:hypothetical protein
MVTPSNRISDQTIAVSIMRFKDPARLIRGEGQMQVREPLRHWRGQKPEPYEGL